uniref:SH2 domain-containing protein n=1 Tax=Panagrolaimus superbus TaxID=310955 RepID=A0A914YHW4_9BILA
MSLLREILDKMYVEPELLEQLDEDQKQTLYIKMREEQIRRWKMHEEEAERESTRLKKNKRSIQWLTGRDGEVWVWVMGDHVNDRTIEEIIEDEAKRRAREIAETEALAASFKMDDSNISDSNMDEQYLKKQLSKMDLGHDLHENGSNGIQHSSLSLYDEASLQSDNNRQLPIIPPQPSYQPMKATPSRNIFENEKEIMNQSFSPPKPALIPPPIPTRPAFLQKKPPQLEPQMPKEEPIQETLRRESNSTPNVYPVPITIKTVNAGPIPFPSGDYTELSPFRTQDLLAAAFIPKKLFNNGNQQNDANVVRMRNASRLADEEIDKRQSEIFEKMMEERDRLKREAEIEDERGRKEFEEQERKSREAEAEIRLIAQRAREHYEKSLRTSESLLPALTEGRATSIKDAIKRSRPPKPLNREAIIQWYIKTEYPKGTGFDPKTKYPARWFHGIISRADAENLLSDKPIGAFLVRISERIWGYTISYVIGPGKSKHFLVETIPEGYQFLGTNQIVHKTLYDLVLYHETAPITAKGKEILRLPVGQTSSVPDYSDLIDTSDMFRFPLRTEMVRRF